jgi:hypothetical protein
MALRTRVVFVLQMKVVLGCTRRRAEACRRGPHGPARSATSSSVPSSHFYAPSFTILSAAVGTVIFIQERLVRLWIPTFGNSRTSRGRLFRREIGYRRPCLLPYYLAFASTLQCFSC